MHQVELFRRYLLKCGHSGFPKLEKDLLFCIEVIKFRVSIFNWSLTWNVVPVVPGKSMCKEKVTYMIYQFGVYIVYSIKCIYIYIYIYAHVIMKTMCPPSYHHNGFLASHVLGHMMYKPTECSTSTRLGA